MEESFITYPRLQGMARNSEKDGAPGAPPEEVSKSQRKREAQEIRSLATRLIALSPARLAEVPLDDTLRREVEAARGIRSHVARKRQMQFVAKLLRRDGGEAVAEALAGFDHEASQLTARQHRSEAWRDHLLEHGDAAVGALLERRRDTDAQTVRQLLRNARREAAHGKPPAAARSLFRLLRDMDEREALPPLP
jgi:ribosome-associated protein